MHMYSLSLYTKDYRMHMYLMLTLRYSRLSDSLAVQSSAIAWPAAHHHHGGDVSILPYGAPYHVMCVHMCMQLVVYL